MIIEGNGDSQRRSIVVPEKLPSGDAGADADAVERRPVGVDRERKVPVEEEAAPALAALSSGGGPGVHVLLSIDLSSAFLASPLLPFVSKNTILIRLPANGTTGRVGAKRHAEELL